MNSNVKLVKFMRKYKIFKFIKIKILWINDGKSARREREREERMISVGLF